MLVTGVESELSRRSSGEGVRVDIVAAAGDLVRRSHGRRSSGLRGLCGAECAVRAWLDRFDVELGRELEVKTGYGAKVFADAANVSLASGERVIERVQTLSVLPAIEAAMTDGDIGAAHVDADAPVRCARSTSNGADSWRRESTVS